MSEKKKPKNILLVDDDQFVRDIYSTKFSESGVDVTPAKNGKEAMKILGEQDFGVVLVDMIMPEMDGVELLQKLDAEIDKDNTSVIVLSNQGQPEDIDKAEQYDIDGYIIKANNVPSEIFEEIIRIYNQ